VLVGKGQAGGQMSRRGGSWLEALAMGGLAAGAAVALTYVVKHYVPLLWFVWLGSGGSLPSY
jgi:hypothetical protein